MYGNMAGCPSGIQASLLERIPSQIAFLRPDRFHAPLQPQLGRLSVSTYVHLRMLYRLRRPRLSQHTVDLDPGRSRGPRLPTDEAAAEPKYRKSFIGRHDRRDSRLSNPEPCSRPQHRPGRSGAMVRRVGAICSTERWGSKCLFLGRRAGMDRRPTRHARCVSFRGPTGSPSRPSVLRLWWPPDSGCVSRDPAELHRPGPGPGLTIPRRATGLSRPTQARSYPVSYL
jgi:hypothetical protein